MCGSETFGDLPTDVIVTLQKDVRLQTPLSWSGCRPSRLARRSDFQALEAPHRATAPGSAPRDLHATQPAGEQTSVGAARARSRRGQGPADRISGRGGSRGAGRAGERAPGGAAVPAAGRPRHRWLAGREGFFYRKGRGRICKVPESPPTVFTLFREPLLFPDLSRSMRASASPRAAAPQHRCTSAG